MLVRIEFASQAPLHSYASTAGCCSYQPDGAITLASSRSFLRLTVQAPLALLRFLIRHMEACVVSDLFACGAELLAVDLDDFAATCQHAGDGSCLEH